MAPSIKRRILSSGFLRFLPDSSTLAGYRLPNGAEKESFGEVSTSDFPQNKDLFHCKIIFGGFVVRSIWLNLEIVCSQKCIGIDGAQKWERGHKPKNIYISKIIVNKFVFVLVSLRHLCVISFLPRPWFPSLIRKTSKKQKDRNFIKTSRSHINNPNLIDDNSETSKCL